MDSDLIYKMAFSFLKGMDASLLRELPANQISPRDFFNITSKDLVRKLNIRNQHYFDNSPRQEALALARAELSKISKHNITPLFLLDDDYPERLSEVEDAPIILYKLGDADLDAQKACAIVGTRRPSPYGVDFCNRLIDDLSVYFDDALIVSGLAYGIDATAHKKALDKNIPTVAVVAHGLNMIYPADHRNLAKEIVGKGGAIISEYPFGVKPFRGNFLARNRIVAALSDITLVIESAVKGGAMSTANFAFSYSRDVMALPGRITDELSGGCNLLIRKQKASLLSSVADIIEVTDWAPLNMKVSPRQRNLFPELEGDSKKIYEYLKLQPDSVLVDKICYETGLGAAKVMIALGELEFDGIVIRHPGNRYSIS